jgi:hypothetical protein
VRGLNGSSARVGRWIARAPTLTDRPFTRTNDPIRSLLQLSTLIGGKQLSREFQVHVNKEIL